ncbi:pyridoxal phosphate-dependent transferase [Ilyonectria robusta]|uniref:pyridoxal phosphate-dependent transferase n=1 Tax=Ilyonectria robusta TaxID=1079257 RepID=UPI001E8D7F6C|nr:pyridoxal phosphate-dependent transferase [Ilyonectria robusta]KAH8665547.1 pyridoxal phosphate-dependent transferase [Ilyonectria robusta]
MIEPMQTAGAYGPSGRALETYKHGKAWDLMNQAKQYPAYDQKTCPGGFINLSGALNILMRDWLKDYCDQNMENIRISQVLSYGSISGGPQLQSAMAAFFNHFFHPSTPVELAQIVATNGVTSMIDLVAWTLCDPGDSVLYLAPTFYMLDYDLASRNGIVGVPVSTTMLDNPFGGDDEDIQKGFPPRILFLCNPANPQGRCYSAKALEALARFCARRRMHLVVDEIYALSHFGDEPFSSVQAIEDDEEAGVDVKQMVHGIYGLSKDFDMGGVRMGFLISRNTAFVDAIKRVTWFTWITAFSEAFVTNFFSQLNLVQEYVSIYQSRLGEAYSRTHEALVKNDIPFQPATSGLFVVVDLSPWMRYFDGPDKADNPAETREVQLCNWLLEGGVFLNPGQFAFSDKPGQFRLVFTEVPIETVVLAVERIRLSLDKLQNGSLLKNMRQFENESDQVKLDDQTTLCVSERVRDENVDHKKTIQLEGGEKGMSRFRLVWQKLNCVQ